MTILLICPAPPAARPRAARRLAVPQLDRRAAVDAVRNHGVHDGAGVTRVHNAEQQTILPVTTVRQAVRVALDRTRRMTLLGSVPVLAVMALPWMLPLHLLIVGLTADHIRHTPEASLSYSDGTTPRLHASSMAIAFGLAVSWSTALWALSEGLIQLDLITQMRAILAIALIAPVVELLGLVEFAICNPEWMTLKRARKRRPDQRTVFVLTSLVSSRDGCGAARRLLDLTYPQWQAADAVVIGYPASKRLVSYYVRMGARRLSSGAAGHRPVGRCVTFDCRRPLRLR